MSESAIRSINPLTFPWTTQDPFLFCAYHRDLYPAGIEAAAPKDALAGRNLGQDFDPNQSWRMYHGTTVPGFPQHPHRGFETVTIVTEGLVDHADSLGAAGRFGNGDVQWMTAGKGVLHSEMFPLLHADQSNPLELFQIWLNLPGENKLVEPHFKMLWSDNIPRIKGSDANGHQWEINLIAGQYSDRHALAPPPHSWAANPKHDVQIWTIRLEPHATLELPAFSGPAHRNVYYYQGESLQIGGEEVKVKHVVEMATDTLCTLVNGDQTSSLLLLQGVPIGEPVAQYGPFVMNTQAEIQQAFQEFRATEFGGWPWPKNDQVHDLNRGRFALHADGREEVK